MRPGLPAEKYIDTALMQSFTWRSPLQLATYRDHQRGVRMQFHYTEGRLPQAVTVQDPQGTTTYLLGYDQVGSLKAVAAMDGPHEGRVVKVVEYDAFGDVLSDSNPALFMPIAFAGGLRDRFTNLVRFCHRDYDPTVGRFTAPDPLGDTGGDHDLYDYCVDEPVGRVDPEGLKAIGIAGRMNAVGSLPAWLTGQQSDIPSFGPTDSRSKGNGILLTVAREGDRYEMRNAFAKAKDPLRGDTGPTFALLSSEGGEGKGGSSGGDSGPSSGGTAPAESGSGNNATGGFSKGSWSHPGLSGGNGTSGLAGEGGQFGASSKDKADGSNPFSGRPTFTTRSTMTDAEKAYLEKAKAKGWGIAFDTGGSIGVGVGESDSKSQSDGAGYGLYFGSSPSGENNDGGLEAGSFKYQTHGAIKGAKVGAGYNLTVFDTSPEKFLQGETGYETWTAGPGAYTVYHDIPTGERIGWGLSVGGKGYGASWEQGVSKGKHAKITR